MDLASIPGGSLRAAALFLALALVAPPVHSQETARRRVLTFSTGLDLSRGDYGQAEDTAIAYTPLSMKYEWEPITVRVTVPYLVIHGPGTVVGGTDGGVIIEDGTATGTSTDFGLGDVVASASYTYYPSSRRLPLVELTGKVKFGTAKRSKALGTGENDYTVQLDVAKSFGRVTPFATAGYRFIGEPPGTDLDDVFLGSVGVGFRITSGLSGGLIIDYRQATSSSANDGLELVPYATIRRGQNFSVGPYAVIGLTNGSPDLGIGFGVNFSR